MKINLLIFLSVLYLTVLSCNRYPSEINLSEMLKYEKVTVELIKSQGNIIGGANRSKSKEGFEIFNVENKIQIKYLKPSYYSDSIYKFDLSNDETDSVLTLLKLAVQTHNPNKKYGGCCMCNNIDFYLISDKIKMEVKPSEEVESIYYKLTEKYRGILIKKDEEYFDKEEIEEKPIVRNIDFTNGKVITETIILKDVTVSLIQKKAPKDNNNYSCHAKIVVLKDNKVIDSIVFADIEAVGGNYGLTKPIIVNNHIIFTKHGDYDGRTILINENGKLFNIIGGENFIDEEADLLFTIYDSDWSGYAVFDLKLDSLLISLDEFEDRPRSIHKEFDNRYFMSCFHDETDQNAIWEFEFDLERTMQIDLDSSSINSSNRLKRIVLNDALF